jgi:hypothetical protein
VVVLCYGLAADAAFELGSVDQAQSLLEEMESVPLGSRSPSLRAQIARVRAMIAAAQGETAAARAEFEEAVAGLRAVGMRFHLAEAMARYGQWLEGQGMSDAAAPVLSEARQIFTELRATWWLDRLRGLLDEGSQFTAEARTTPA